MKQESVERTGKRKRERPRDNTIEKILNKKELLKNTT